LPGEFSRPPKPTKLELLVLTVRALTSEDAYDCYCVAEALATGNHFGLRVSTNLPLAVRFYETAARKGRRDAQYELGFVHLQGEGVAVNIAEGLRWMTASAEQGNIDAMRVLVDGYSQGVLGIEPNEALAKHWRARLAEQRKREREDDRG
jgi:hypothetical protein